jgi:hypothetical protein
LAAHGTSRATSERTGHADILADQPTPPDQVRQLSYSW